MMLLRWLMKKLEFGYNTDDRLNATWSEIEAYNGEYLDTVNFQDRDFLVTRIVDSLKGLNGAIDVREVAQDYYSDGSYLTYANKEKDSVCNRLELFLNNPKIREQLKDKRVLEILRDNNFPAYSSRLLQIESKSEEIPEVVTSVRPEMFKKLKDSKRMTLGMSIYNMTEEIQRLNAQIEILQAKSNGKGR